MTALTGPPDLLFWFASNSNMASIVIVVLCFLAMTIFIYHFRLFGDYPSTPDFPSALQQRPMVRVSNPFIFQLDKTNQELKDGLKLHLSTLCPCKVVVVWGPKINPFHDFILLPGNKIRDELTQDANPSEIGAFNTEIFELPVAGQHSVVASCPDSVTSETLGAIPRQRYPVVAFAFVQDTNVSMATGRSCQEDGGCCDEAERQRQHVDHENYNTVVGLIAIIHLKDETVQQDSHVIGEYIKTRGVPLYSLKPLFISNDASNASASSSDHPSNSEESRNSGEPKSNSADVTKSIGLPHCNGRTRICHGIRQESQGDLPSDHPDSTADAQVMSSEDDDRLQTSHSHQDGRLGLRRRTTHMNDKSYRVASSPEEEVDGSLEESQNEGGNTDDERHSVRDRNMDETRLDGEKIPSNLPDCVACQSHRAVCVILPCRHACVCLHCLQLLDKCPMCRGNLESYFLLEQDRVDENEDDSEDENMMLHHMHQRAVAENFYQMVARLNTRLNEWLGFH